MLLKKLAKLRRTILWCAVFAVSHLAFGADIAADPLGNLGMPDFYSAELGGYRCFAPGDSVTIVTNASTKGTVKCEVIYGVDYNNLRFSTESEFGYHLEHWKTYGKYVDTNPSSATYTQGYYMPTNYIEKASLLLVHALIYPEPKFKLEPIFLPNTYTVTFDLAGGALPEGTSNTKVVTFDSTYGDLPTPILANYTFTGWVRKYVDSDEEKKSEPITAKSPVKTAADHELTATWKEYDKYKITVRRDVNVAEEMICSTSDEPEPFPVKSGEVIYVHEGGWIKLWGSAASSGYKVINSSEETALTLDPVVPDGTLRLVATPNAYTVSFDLACPEDANPPPPLSPITVIYGSSYGSSENPLPTPARVGYNFVGWFLDKETRIYDSTTVKTAADHTLVASWQKKRYDMSVSISAGEGKIEPTASGTYDFETSVQRTAVPATGYSFDCWDDDATLPAMRLITILDDTDNRNANKYSVSFKPNQYTVSFDIAPAAASEKPSTATTPAKLDPTTVTYDSTYGELPSVSHIEYNFLGWYTDPNGGALVESSTLFQTAAPVTLYARWEKLQRYKVSLEEGPGVSAIYYMRDGEDSAWSPYSGSVNVISNRMLSAYVVAKEGYTADYTDNTPFVSGEIAADSSFTLTASPNPYTVSFNSKGGNKCDPQDVTMDATYGKLPVPTLDGAKFLGWYLGEDRITAETIFSKATDVTLTAKWEGFDSNLTEAADCVGLMLRSEGEPHYTVGEVDTAYTNGVKVGDACVRLSLDPQDNSSSRFLISDIEGSGKLSFWWKLQNQGFVDTFETVATLEVIKTGQSEPTKPCKFENKFGGEFPITAWRYEEIELKDVASLSWCVSSVGSPYCEFYLDKVKWEPEGGEKTELEKWAELLGCTATEDAVAAAKLAVAAELTLSITIDSDGKPDVSMPNLDTTKPYASKVKIECCEDLSNPTWIEHDPAQHSKCRFYRGILVL